MDAANAVSGGIFPDRGDVRTNDVRTVPAGVFANQVHIWRCEVRQSYYARIDEELLSAFKLNLSREE